jgi:hypothetical protein
MASEVTIPQGIQLKARVLCLEENPSGKKSAEKPRARS